MSIPFRLRLALLCFLAFAQTNPRKTEEELFGDFRELMRGLGKWKGLTQKERQYRFGVYKKNLGVVSKPVPPPKDKFGRPLLGLVAFAYKKRLNKFAVYTEVEFENKFLMSVEVLFRSSAAQRLRESPNYSFRAFLRRFEGEDFQLDFGSPRAAQGQPAEPRPQAPGELGGGSGADEDFFPSDADTFFGGRRLQESELPPNVKRSVNWEHLFGEVFDQLDCNSCYATAAVSAVEAMHQKAFPETPKFSLSVQEVLDCSRENAGCDGGQPSAVMQYLEKFGVAYAGDYPYQGQILSCKAQYSHNAVKDQSGPPKARLLEELLGGGPPRLLQWTRFSASPTRFGNFGAPRIPVPPTTSRFQRRRFRNDRFSANRVNSNPLFSQSRNFSPQVVRTPRRGVFSQPRNSFNRNLPGGLPTQSPSNFSPSQPRQPRFTPRSRTSTRGTSLGSLSRFRSNFIPPRSPVSESQGGELLDFDEPATGATPSAQSPSSQPASPGSPAGRTPPVSASPPQAPSAPSTPAPAPPAAAPKPSPEPTPSFKDDLLDLEPLEEASELASPSVDKEKNSGGTDSSGSGKATLENSKETLPSKNENESTDAGSEGELEELEELEELSEAPSPGDSAQGAQPSDGSNLSEPTSNGSPPNSNATSSVATGEPEEAQPKGPAPAEAEETPEATPPKEPESKEEGGNPFGFTDDLMDLDELPEEEATPPKEGASPAEPEPPKAESPEPEAPEPTPNPSGNEGEPEALEPVEGPKEAAEAAQKRYEKVQGFYFIRQNVVDLIRALQYGPVVVAHYVSEPFKFYARGVFDGDGCKDGKLDHVNHASVIVGYDLDAPIPYFKFRNSWADDWGEKGHYRIKIGELTKRNKGVCLVAGTPFMVFAKVQ